MRPSLRTIRDARPGPNCSAPDVFGGDIAGGQVCAVDEMCERRSGFGFGPAGVRAELAPDAGAGIAADGDDELPVVVEDAVNERRVAVGEDQFGPTRLGQPPGTEIDHGVAKCVSAGATSRVVGSDRVPVPRCAAGLVVRAVQEAAAPVVVQAITLGVGRWALLDHECCDRVRAG